MGRTTGEVDGSRTGGDQADGEQVVVVADEHREADTQPSPHGGGSATVYNGGAVGMCSQLAKWKDEASRLSRDRTMDVLVARTTLPRGWYGEREFQSYSRNKAGHVMDAWLGDDLVVDQQQLGCQSSNRRLAEPVPCGKGSVTVYDGI